jgi:uncharacterized protein YeeX (DUF496 family)
MALLGVLAGKLGDLGFRLSEYSPFFAKYVLQPVSLWVVKGAVKTYKKNGEKGWDDFYLPAFRALGKSRSTYLSKKMDMQPEDVSTMARYHDYEDPLLGIEGHWEKKSKTESVRIETVCFLGDYIKEQKCHQVCQKLVCAMEIETVRSLNEEYNLDEPQELISKGDSRCVFVHRIKD